MLTEVEQFAMGEYAAGARRRQHPRPVSASGRSRKSSTATPGLPVEYIERANLRVNGGEFEHMLQDRRRAHDRPPRLAVLRADDGRVAPRRRNTIHSRRRSRRRTSRRSTSTRASSSKFGKDQKYKPVCRGRLPGLEVRPQAARVPAVRDPGFPNVIGDLAAAMKYNPNLRVMLNSGYYDLATPLLRGRLRDEAPADPAGTRSATSRRTTTSRGTWSTRT